MKIVKYEDKYFKNSVEVFKDSISNQFLKEKIDDKLRVEWLIKQKEKLLKDKENMFFVAFIDNEIVGIIGLTKVSAIVKDNFNFDYTNSLEISSLYIKTEYQKRGVGKKLFHHVLEKENIRDTDNVFIYTGFKSGRLFWDKILSEQSIAIKEKYWDNRDSLYIWRKKNKKVTRVTFFIKKI